VPWREGVTAISRKTVGELMNRRLVILLLLLAALVLCYGLAVRLAPMPVPTRAAALRPAAPAAGRASSLPAQEAAAGFDEVTVKIPIPPMSTFPAAWATGKGCPHSKLSAVLGVNVGAGNGCPVLNVEPGKAADRAGIRVRDRLGAPEDCASSLYSFFAPRKQPRTISWVIRRPRKAGPPISPPARQRPAPSSRRG